MFKQEIWIIGSLGFFILLAIVCGIIAVINKTSKNDEEDSTDSEEEIEDNRRISDQL